MSKTTPPISEQAAQAGFFGSTVTLVASAIWLGHWDYLVVGVSYVFLFWYGWHRATL